MSIKIITFNVNSVNARLEQIEELIGKEKPDILLFQELKCEEVKFPHSFFEDRGYNIALKGQKSYNGVAILRKFKIEEETTVFFDVQDARFIETKIIANSIPLTIINVYVPNGKEVESESFKYKLKFFSYLFEYLEEKFISNEQVIIAGDFNVAINDADVFDAKSLKNTVCFHNDERAWIKRIINLGFSDIFRELYPSEKKFSWWDYRASGFQHNKGLRIDYFLVSPNLVSLVKDVKYLEQYRGLQKASDHCPVEIEL
ncbi:MAG: exodeoxyribonuclease III [Alphaproteobacteria bacterium]